VRLHLCVILYPANTGVTLPKKRYRTKGAAKSVALLVAFTNPLKRRILSFGADSFFVMVVQDSRRLYLQTTGAYHTTSRSLHAETLLRIRNIFSARQERATCSQ